MAAWHELDEPFKGSPVWEREDGLWRVRASIIEPGTWIVMVRIDKPPKFRWVGSLGRFHDPAAATIACDAANPVEKEGTCNAEATD